MNVHVYSIPYICENLDIFAFEMTQYCEIIYGCAYFFADSAAAVVAFKYLYMCIRVYKQDTYAC